MVNFFDFPIVTPEHRKALAESEGRAKERARRPRVRIPAKTIVTLATQDPGYATLHPGYEFIANLYRTTLNPSIIRQSTNLKLYSS